MVVYFGVQERLFDDQEESRNCVRYMYTQALQGWKAWQEAMCGGRAWM